MEKIDDIKRLVLIGAESTGKTTLAKQLATHFNTLWVPEYGRYFVDQQQRLPRYEEMLFIAEQQQNWEKIFSRNAYRLLFCDTNVWTTEIYGRYYFNRENDTLTALAKKQQATAYLFTQPDFPWVADPGQRDGIETQQALHLLFQETLDRNNLPYFKLFGTKEERLERAIQIARRFLE